MRTDINRISEFTTEMELNDKLYDEMEEEFEQELNYLSAEAPEFLADMFESMYFKRRILYLLKNYDLPLKCAIGLYFNSNRLELLDAFRDEYISDEDADAEILKYVLEFGYRTYEQIADPGESACEVLKKVKLYRDIEQEWEENDDE